MKITDTTGRGATWLDDGSIVFSSFDDLRRISADGGETEVLATPDREKRQKSLRFPDALPGGRVVLFTIGSADMESWDDATIAVLTLETGEIRTLIEGGTNARYSPTGHIVYARGRGLFAVPFDASSLEVTGAPVLVLEPVSTHPLNGPAQFAVSPTGSLLYAPGGPWMNAGRVVMVSRAGTVEPLVDAPQPFRRPRITPDGRRLALEMHSANHSIWTYDFARGALTRLISGFNNYGPLWAPDGSALAFTSDTRGQNDVYMSPGDGSGEPELLTPDEGPAAYAISWSPVGRFLLYVAFSPKTRGDIMVLPLAENRTPRVFLHTDANESIARFSPDGRWVAHQSDESGRAEIYLRSFHDPGPKWQVSTEGGADPIWNPQGGELFYHDGGKMMAVDIDLNDAPRLGKPRLLFERSFDSSTGSGYDVMPDGERFIMIDQSQTTVRPTELIVVQNFAEELRRLVPERPSGRSH